MAQEELEKTSPIGHLWNHTRDLIGGLILFGLIKPVLWASFWVGARFGHTTPPPVQDFLAWADDAMLIYFVILLSYHFVVETWPFNTHRKRSRAGEGQWDGSAMKSFLETTVIGLTGAVLSAIVISLGAPVAPTLIGTMSVTAIGGALLRRRPGSRRTETIEATRTRRDGLANSHATAP